MQAFPVRPLQNQIARLDHVADRLSSEMMIEFIEPPGAAPSDDVKVGARIPGARVRGMGVTPK